MAGSWVFPNNTDKVVVTDVGGSSSGAQRRHWKDEMGYVNSILFNSLPEYYVSNRHQRSLGNLRSHKNYFLLQSTNLAALV